MKTIYITPAFQIGDSVTYGEGKTGTVTKVNIVFDEQYNQGYTYTVAPIPVDGTDPVELSAWQM